MNSRASSEVVAIVGSDLVGSDLVGSDLVRTLFLQRAVNSHATP